MKQRVLDGYVHGYYHQKSLRRGQRVRESENLGVQLVDNWYECVKQVRALLKLVAAGSEWMHA